MKIFALADTHLSFGRPKPMDVFGALWRDHPRQIAEAWDARVRDDDVVLVPGDISWAHSAEDVRPDLEFLAARPGRLKLLSKGNHDSWWSSAAKVRRILPQSLEILSGGAVRFREGVVICGARGWNLPEDPWFEEGRDRRLYERELKRLELSLDEADRIRQPGDVCIAMLHYPPLGPERTESEVLTRLRAAAVDLAVYGHLHGDDHDWAPQGSFAGVRLRCVAADYVRFMPQEIYDESAGILAEDSLRATGGSD